MDLLEFILLGVVCLISFLDMEVNVVHQIWGVLGHDFFKYSFCFFSIFLLSLGLSLGICWYTWCCHSFWGSVHFSSFFKFILLTMDNLRPDYLQLLWFFLLIDQICCLMPQMDFSFQFYIYICICICIYPLWLHLWHMEVPRQGTESKPQMQPTP